MANINTAQDHLTNQREYVKKRQLEGQRAAAQKGGASGMVDEKMLAETMRSVRYEDEAHAAGDIIDNAIEAGGSQIHVVFRTEGEAIKEIAFIDDASGIDPDFLPHAVKWGGSSNDGERNTFGRFGFGLPSASVNRGRKFSVYSRIDGQAEFSSVTVDLDALKMENGVVPLPTIDVGPIPGWVSAYVATDSFKGSLTDVRTVVVWSKLDKLEWKNRQQSTARFREHLGITYSSWLDVCSMSVNGEPVEPVDVLFTTPDYRYYEIDGAPKANPQRPITFEVPDSDGARHTVTVRFSLLSMDAMDARVASGGRGAPPRVRMKIRLQYNGFFTTRNGRFIELARPKMWQWNNYAAQVGMAIDFPPALDDLFGVTPDKQTIIFTDRLIKLLVDAGVERAYRALYKEIEAERAKRKAERDAKAGEDRPSERVIARTLERSTKTTRKATKETQKEATDNLKKKVKELAKETGLPEEQIEAAQEKLAEEKPYVVEFESGYEDGAFYNPTMVGTQLVLRINTGHAWYREVYSKLRDDQGELRSALEYMLFVLAVRETDATDDSRIFYRAERRAWSELLADGYDIHPLVYNKVHTKEELDEDDPTPWADDFEESEAS